MLRVEGKRGRKKTDLGDRGHPTPHLPSGAPSHTTRSAGQPSKCWMISLAVESYGERGMSGLSALGCLHLQIPPTHSPSLKASGTAMNKSLASFGISATQSTGCLLLICLSVSVLDTGLKLCSCYISAIVLSYISSLSPFSFKLKKKINGLVKWLSR